MSRRHLQKPPASKSAWSSWKESFDARRPAVASHTGPPALATPRWVLGALLASLCLAALCLYGAICLLFWQGQWQLVFGRSTPVAKTPASIGIPYQEVGFDTTQTGVMRLNGWWVPAEADTRFDRAAILLLRDGTGSLSDSLAQIAAIHKLGINIFAFDYRGFGSSEKIHPSEKSVSEDAGAAWNYLTGIRHLAPDSIVPYGIGLGASVAAELTAAHPESPFVILENPAPPVLKRLRQHPNTRFLPVRLLFHDRFDPSHTLGQLSTPKLFVGTGSPTLYFDAASQPKEQVTVRGSGDSVYQDPAYGQSVTGFLNEYLRPVPPAAKR